MACALTFPTWMVQPYRDLFCKLLEVKSAFPQSDFTPVKQAILVSSPTVPIVCKLDTREYTHHPASVHANGRPLGVVTDFTQGTSVGVSRVEIVGNGDESRWLDSDAKYGNLYLTAAPGYCQEWSAPVSLSYRRWDDFRDILYTMKLRQEEYNGKAPDPSLMGFPSSVATLKTSAAVMVSTLPGPYATHVPDELAGTPGALPQGEFGLQWQSIQYDPPKPAFVMGDPRLPGVLRSPEIYCLRVMQAHGDSTRVMQWPVKVSDLLQKGAHTYAHNINNYKSVLRGAEAESSPALFKITLTPQNL